MIIEELPEPFPEVTKASEDKSIREQFLELQAREKREVEAALNAKLDSINTSGDIAELKANLKLRCQWVDKYGWKAFADLNGRHLRRQIKEKAEAELAAKQSKRQLSTEQGRIDALNKVRIAAR